MNSEDLLNQPTPDELADDPHIPSESMNALAKFLGKGPQDPSEASSAPPQSQPTQTERTNPLAGMSSMAPADAEEQAKGKSKPTQSTASPSAKGIEKELENAKTELERLQMSPEERYRQILEDRGIELFEAQKILDCIIVQLKPYQERVPLTDSLHVVFKTRTQGDQDRLNRVLEGMSPKYRATMDSEVARQHLVSSIVSYGGRSFSREDDEEIEEVVKWVTDIPQPAFILLQRKLYEFDRKIDAVFQEGYIENFWPTAS